MICLKLLLLIALPAPGQTPKTELPPDKAIKIERIEKEETPKVWKAEEFRIVPVRVHLIRAPDTAAGTTLKTEDIERVFRKANGIWHAAGVHLWVESIVSEKRATLEGHTQDLTLPLEALLPLRPLVTDGATCFHIYYIHAMAPNGIYMRRDGIFVKETAKLRDVPGGIDEPLPRVSAHELGHGMGLPHRQDTTNLMASGTTGTSLNSAEIEIVRNTLATFSWVQTSEEFLKNADKLAKDKNTILARSYYRALLELPNASPLKDKAKASLKHLK